MNDRPVTATAHEAVPNARDVFLAWERFRLAYNLILVAVVVLAIMAGRGSSLFADGNLWRHLAIRALVANFCFGLGPWVEGWLRVAGEGGTTTRWVLFLSGTGLSALLAVVFVLGFGKPAWD